MNCDGRHTDGKPPCRPNQREKDRLTGSKGADSKVGTVFVSYSRQTRSGADAALTKEGPMPQFRYKEAHGRADEITVIEDKSMFVKDGKGNWSPGFEFIDSHTVKAHPFIIDALLVDAERLWTLDEILQPDNGTAVS